MQRAEKVTNPLVSGQIDIYFNAGNLGMAQVKQGNLRVLASVGTKRTEETLDLPTLSEAGLRGVAVLPWFGPFAPAGMPRPLVERLNREVTAILKTPAMKERASQRGAELMASTPEALIKLVKVEIPQMAQLMQKARVTPE